MRNVFSNKFNSFVSSNFNVSVYPLTKLDKIHKFRNKTPWINKSPKDVASRDWKRTGIVQKKNKKKKKNKNKEQKLTVSS